jgi:hypothetical protein
MGYVPDPNALIEMSRYAYGQAHPSTSGGATPTQSPWNQPYAPTHENPLAGDTYEGWFGWFAESWDWLNDTWDKTTSGAKDWFMEQTPPGRVISQVGDWLEGVPGWVGDVLKFPFSPSGTISGVIERELIEPNMPNVDLNIGIPLNLPQMVLEGANMIGEVVKGSATNTGGTEHTGLGDSLAIFLPDFSIGIEDEEFVEQDVIDALNELSSENEALGTLADFLITGEEIGTLAATLPAIAGTLSSLGPLVASKVGPVWNYIKDKIVPAAITGYAVRAGVKSGTHGLDVAPDVYNTIVVPDTTPSTPPPQIPEPPDVPSVPPPPDQPWLGYEPGTSDQRPTSPPSDETLKLIQEMRDRENQYIELISENQSLISKMMEALAAGGARGGAQAAMSGSPNGYSGPMYYRPSGGGGPLFRPEPTSSTVKRKKKKERKDVDPNITSFGDVPD